MTRKEFLTLLAAGSASQALAQAPVATPPAATPAPAAKPKVPPLKLPPIQPGPPYLLAGPMLGHAGPNEARIWIRATASVPWSVRISESAALADAREFTGPAANDESGCTAVAIIDGLKPATRYFYAVSLDGRAQTVAPLPSFVTAPEPGAKGRQRIAFGSCVGDTIASAAPTWGELAARRVMDAKSGGFELLLMLGDNHYANTTEIPKLRTYYTAHRLSAGWRDLTARTPVYAVWDDHDYGPNNSDGTQKGKEDSLRIFHEFWANAPCADAANDGCYFTFTRGAAQFFMLDCRFHRSPNAKPDGPEKTMWGAKQLAWLKRELLASRATFKILAQGSEWETFGSEDSFGKFLHERDAFFAWIDEQKIEGVVLLSGDRHFSAGYHVRKRFLELSSSPLGSGNARLGGNAERFTGWDDGRMWMVLDLDTSGASPAFAYELWKTGGGMLERRAFTWAQLHGREPIALSPSPLVPPRATPKPAAPPIPA